MGLMVPSYRETPSRACPRGVAETLETLDRARMVRLGTGGTGRSARARADKGGHGDRPDAFFVPRQHTAPSRGEGRGGEGRGASRDGGRARGPSRSRTFHPRNPSSIFRRPGSRDRVRLARGRVRHGAARRVPSPTDANGRKKAFLPFPQRLTELRRHPARRSRSIRRFSRLLAREAVEPRTRSLAAHARAGASRSRARVPSPFVPVPKGYVPASSLSSFFGSGTRGDFVRLWTLGSPDDLLRTDDR